MNSYWPKILKQSKWARSLPEEVQSEIATSLQPRTVQEGAEVIRQGDPYAGLACVIEGEMEVVGTARNGDELLIGFLRDGDWTGFLASIDHGLYAFSVRAKKKTRIAILSPSATERIFERDLERFRLLLEPELCVSRSNYNYFIEIAYRPPMQRLAERMLGLGTWPYSAGPEGPFSFSAVAQADLANATRLSRQTINSCLQSMARCGIVDVGYRSVEVRNLEQLVKIAQGDLVIE